MNGITISIDPMIAHAGPFMLSWYNLFFILAVLAGGWLGLREARRKGIDTKSACIIVHYAKEDKA